MNRQGLSPLIATLLLISFAISLGVVIMSFGQAQVDLQADCPLEIDMDFLTISNKKQICHTSNELQFTVENGINIKISGLIVNVIGENSAQTTEFNKQIIKAGTYKEKVKFTDQIQLLKITPKIELHNKEFICREQSLIIEQLPKC